MGKLVDLTGKKFGYLTVIKRDRDHITPSGSKSPKWICKCDCGNKVSVIAYSLTSGKTTSCGCYQKKNASNLGKKYIKQIYNFDDLCGKRFGRLTVIEAVQDRYGNGSVIYQCECDCGKKVFVPSKHLKGGCVKSCGCLASETASERIFKLGLPQATCYKGTKVCCLNNTIFKNNTTGVRGVYFDKQKKKYIARLNIQGKQHLLGAYEKLEDAKRAREQAEEELWKPIIEEYEKQ